MSMIELNMNRPGIAERLTVNFAETRSITPSTKRLYDGAAMVPYNEAATTCRRVRFPNGSATSRAAVPARLPK